MRYSNATRAGRALKNGHKSLWTPDSPALGLHLGTISNPNHFNGEAQFNWADGSDPNVLPYMQSYGPGNLPEDGHDAWVLQYGDSYMIVGRQVRPVNVITI